MKKIHFPVLPIKTALSISFVSVFFLFFMVVSTIMFYTSEKMVTDSTRQLAHQEVEEVQQRVNTYLSEIKVLASSLAYNSNIVEYVKTAGHSDFEKTDWHRRLNYVVTGSIIKEKGMHSVGVFSRKEVEGLYFGDTSMQSVYQTRQMYPQYSRLDEIGEECVWIPPFQLKYSAHKLVALQYRIVDVDTFQELGVLTVNLKTLYLNNLLSRYGMAGYLYLADENGEIIAQNKSETLPLKEITKEIDRAGENDVTHVIDGEKYIISYDTLPVTGWRMIGLIPIRELQNNIRNGQILMITSMLVGAVLVIVLSLIISAKISRPIALLTEGMKAIQCDNLGIRIQDQTFLETKRLSQGFNEMLDDINELLIKTYQQELMERDIRLEALQAKISPHFLYNTLETINALLILEENYETSNLVSSLAELLRYSISDSKQIMTVEEELRYIKDYFYIHKVRFGDRFEYRIEMDEEVRSCKIMKMLIQPIVENAVIHGIENKVGKGEVFINAKSENGEVYISVKDNGIGMTQEKVAEILSQKPPTQAECRIGLRNVISRIHLHYGETYGVTIQSTPMIGTTVLIHVPGNR
ncbi:Inner membrane protein ypdA [uncultured Ruminococcus sp.]|uniref:Sensor histidine kinase n=1 Tax=Massiliimalia timonensis TaxID=1987501 RepID=A0A8J6PG37_9FIRM|nr:sensor histidine kinase [Massiliimalia timonensis]MBC8611297.1 sensor histidine kinase [Massiliimalia timonensis]SCH06976.1 Inner membrane protein ypdA [uncultured Clostridium sp.]SCI03080.1 Inner membrane protein ypdA [uncultured Ruminococcus sp.]